MAVQTAIGYNPITGTPIYQNVSPWGGTTSASTPSTTTTGVVSTVPSAAPPPAPEFTPLGTPRNVGTQVGRYEQNVLKEYPGYETIMQHASGELPSDVLNQIFQGGAERGVATGNIGGAGTNAAMLRALGLTSLDLQKTGLSELAQATSILPKINPEGLYVPLGQVYGAEAAGAQTDAELAAREQLQREQLAAEAARQQASLAQQYYSTNTQAALQQQALAQQAALKQQEIQNTLAGRAASGEAIAASLQPQGGYYNPASLYGTGTGGDQAYQNWQALFGGLSTPAHQSRYLSTDYAPADYDYSPYFEPDLLAMM